MDESLYCQMDSHSVNFLLAFYELAGLRNKHSYSMVGEKGQHIPRGLCCLIPVCFNIIDTIKPSVMEEQLRARIENC